jgi:putative addiction module component (TIGR02574 family)
LIRTTLVTKLPIVIIEGNRRKLMIRNSAKVVNDALSLPPRSRAKLAEKLLESLDDPRRTEIDHLWAEEVEDRIDAYEKGYLKSIPGKEVFRRLKLKKKR